MKTKNSIALGLFVVTAVIFSVIFSSVVSGLFVGAFSVFLFFIVTS